ncbi:MAG: 30S ribosomal protein S20 [Nitrospirae bacterium]|nr:30S ribosomal protein S20 [Nitrospirota bacterium]
MATKPVKKNESALKRARQEKTRTEKNRSVKSVIRTLAKKLEAEVNNKNAENANAILKKAVSAIDKAAKNGIIHKNNAARKVSRLTRIVNSLSSAEAA